MSPRALGRGWPILSTLAFSVLHWTATSRSGREFVNSFTVSPLLSSVAQTVGQDEQSLAAVTGSQRGAGEHSPFRIEPQRGQVSEDGGESVAHEAGDVLQEDEAGSHVAAKGGDERPEPPLVLFALPFAGDAPGLTGEAGGEHVALNASAILQVGINGHPRPTLGQDATTEIVAFHEAHRPEVRTAEM